MATIHLYRPTDTEEAFTLWKANCGPCAIAALAGVNLAQVRSHILNWKGYTTPSMALQTLRSLGVMCEYGKPRQWPEIGLVCIQFGGPWCEKGVHWAEPYKRSHYIAVAGDAVYDVNCDKWVHRRDWEAKVAPWLASTYPKADGTWYPRSCIVVENVPERIVR